MPPDRFENDDPLAFLGLKERELLGKLAEKDGRTDLEELRWLIRARALGRLKDLGDDVAPPQVPEDNLSADYVHVKSVRVGRESGRSAEANPASPDRPKPR